MLSVENTTTLSTYPQVVDYLQHTYAANKCIEDKDDEETIFTQPLNKTSSGYD